MRYFKHPYFKAARNFVIMIAALAGVVWLFGGCASVKVYRLGPGENIVIQDKGAIYCAGSGCVVQRVYR